MHAQILVVDDDDDVRRLLVDTLSIAGYRVESAADGARALQMIGRQDFDLVLVDFVMPGMSGSDVMQEIRTRLPQQKLLIVTGYADTSVLKDASGATPVLGKPFARETLLAAVRDAMET